jgi:hypothetical protein
MNSVPTFIELQAKLVENSFESFDDKVNTVLFEKFTKNWPIEPT